VNTEMNNNLDKYKNAFIETFNIEEKQLESLEYQGINEWDSVGHMNLVAVLEEYFDIMMDTDDIVDLSSFNKGLEILKKYEIEF